MTSKDFANWLAGFLEAAGGKLNEEQARAVLAKAQSVQSTEKFGSPATQPVPVVPQIWPYPFPAPHTEPVRWPPRFGPDIWWGDGITCAEVHTNEVRS